MMISGGQLIRMLTHHILSAVTRTRPQWQVFRNKDRTAVDPIAQEDLDFIIRHLQRF